MDKVKHTFLAAAALLCCMQSLSAQTPAGSIEYSLPRTSLVLEVEASGTVFSAGPYAKYAQKLLGISVKDHDETTWTVSGITLSSTTEADPQARFHIAGSKTFFEETGAFLSPTPFGFISVPKCDAGVQAHSSFSAVKNAEEGSVAPLTENILEASNLEAEARAAAELILGLRQTRLQIITGDTDATYSGEAMKAVLDEISRLENLYLTLFTGSCRTENSKTTYTISPDAASSQCVAFRLSPDMGLLSADDADGVPFMLDIRPESVAPSQGEQSAKTTVKYEIHSRIPSVCRITLSDGSRQYLQARVPMYQYGKSVTYPVAAK